MESYKFFASLIANWNRTVIIPELPRHGERGSLDYKDAVTLQANFWPIVIQGVEEATEIVTELSHTNEAPITVIGHSTGGFIAGGTYARHHNVRSAVVINGSCAWVKFEELYREKLGFAPMEAKDIETLQSYDPFSFHQPSSDRRLLLLHCEKDSSVPIDSQRYFMQERSTQEDDQIRLIEFAGVDHQITLSMLQKIKEFLDTNH